MGDEKQARPERQLLSDYLRERGNSYAADLIEDAERAAAVPAVPQPQPAPGDELVETIAAWLYEEFSDYDDWGHAPQRKREYYLDRARELAAALPARPQPAPEPLETAWLLLAEARDKLEAIRHLAEREADGKRRQFASGAMVALAILDQLDPK